MGGGGGRRHSLLEALHALPCLPAQPPELPDENERLDLRGEEIDKRGMRLKRVVGSGVRGVGGSGVGRAAGREGGRPAGERQRGGEPLGTKPGVHLPPHTLFTSRGTSAMTRKNCSGGESSEKGPRYIFRALVSSMEGAICSGAQRAPAGREVVKGGRAGAGGTSVWPQSCA